VATGQPFSSTAAVVITPPRPDPINTSTLLADRKDNQLSDQQGFTLRPARHYFTNS
jgi:hypothetical protein